MTYFPSTQEIIINNITSLKILANKYLWQHTLFLCLDFCLGKISVGLTFLACKQEGVMSKLREINLYRNRDPRRMNPDR